MRGRLPDWARVSRPTPPWRDRSVLVTDLVLSLVCGVPVVLGALLPDPRAGLWTAPAALLATVALVAMARVFPLLAMPVVIGASLVAGNFVFVAPVVGFLAGRRMRYPKPAVVLVAAVVVTGTIATPLLGIPTGEWLNGMVVLMLGLVMPWLAGRSWRQYRTLTETGWERAEQLEREQHLVADQARLRERARIAQDMHDSLGHELSLLGLRAGALELAAELSDDSRATARDLRLGAADATERLREIIGVLRDETDPARVEPPDETIADLVGRAADSGLDVVLVEDGEPPTDRPGAMARLAAHRVVQEALTNAAKHAPGAAVTVRVEWSSDVARVEVTNAPPARVPEPAAGGGTGLVGLRERARLAGGDLRAQATENGGFAVVASLPHAVVSTAGGDGGHQAGGDTESARRRADARRRFRRSVALSITVPACIVALLGVVFVVQYTYNVYTSTMSADTYERLRVGQPRTAVAGELPRQQYEERARVVEPPRPAGARCEYYRVQRRLVNLPSDVYRLCFVDGRLASKHTISGDAPRVDDSP